MKRLLGIPAAALAAAALAMPAGAATLVVEGGVLTGARGVLVNGQSYDVAFVDGSCAQVFTGCDSVSDFDASTEIQALAFAQALVDQVFLDGPRRVR